MPEQRNLNLTGGHWGSSSKPGTTRFVTLVWLGLAGWPGDLLADYKRPVDAAPSPKDIGGGYVTPQVQRPLPRSVWWRTADVVLLGAAMGIGAWIVLRRRNRNALIVLTVGCLVYFGFHRKGCICPVGSIQNVAVALTDSNYAVGYVVVATFFLPLVMALLFGRVFCGGVCPLGGIQDLVLLRPVQVPRRLDKMLGLLRYVYLLAAIGLAVQPAVDRDFIICRFDPFVGFFRRTGTAEMLLTGGGILVAAMFVGRLYCRYLCPYGAVLSVLSRWAWKSVSITPSDELDCGLCHEACPYGAIENMRAVRSSCLCCARCFRYCPVHRTEGSGIHRDKRDAPSERGAPP